MTSVLLQTVRDEAHLRRWAFQSAMDPEHVRRRMGEASWWRAHHPVKIVWASPLDVRPEHLVVPA